jgi:aldose 1-epimerase
VQILTLRNNAGMSVRITSYGGIVLSLLVPNRQGNLDDVVLGYDAPEEYREDRQYFGAVVGRFANRIAGARFTLDGHTYRLAANDGPNHLHGGFSGFSKALWDVIRDDARSVVLRHLSPDGDEGYPGTLDARVTYSVTDRNELVVDFAATTDRATPVNLTQHSYFNLAGQHSGSLAGHTIRINADTYVPVDDELLPTGELAPVADTRCDFRGDAPVVAGIDNPFVLKGEGEKHAARLVHAASGRTLDVYTTEPGLHLYTGHPAGLCLETQHFPDSPNRPDFPSTILRPDSEFHSRTVFAFGCLAPTRHDRGS